MTARLNAIDADDWGHPTPCPAWDVRQLVNHVIGLHFRVARLIGGGTRAEYVDTRDSDWIDSRHDEAWRESILLLDKAIRGTSSLDTVVDYRVPLSARDLIALAAFDTAVHTWDLSRAIGADEHLEYGLAKFSLGVMRWIRSQPELVPLFGSVEPPQDSEATAQQQLLRLAGRQP